MIGQQPSQQQPQDMRKMYKLKLVNELKKTGFIKSPRVAEVMFQVDRGEFWGSGQYDFNGNPQAGKDFINKDAYEDNPRPINFNVVISAPKLHSFVLDLLEDVLTPGARVLDVGSGTGILCACFYEMAKKEDGSANIVGIEHIEHLAQVSFQNLSKSYSKQLQDQSIKLVVGDGRLGFPEGAPFDAIHVGAGTP
mmetsp:Transcript_4221/g.7168  ORF Transcript_4221/g.7168 Transcript_4221/m.7168 type:complete len:194 (+) Transcript_4221:3-584(+)